MNEKFKEYLLEIGVRYAVTWAKYERVRLSTVQLWCAQLNESEHMIPALETESVARLYMQAPASPQELPAPLPGILRKQAF